MSSSRSSGTSSASSTTMGLSSAVVAVLAASAVSYYYHSSSKKDASTTNRDLATDPDSNQNDSDSRLQLWEDRWSTGRTQWHKTDAHASLQKYCDEYVLDGIIGGGGRVLVPLCGKTVDMVYFARKRVVSQVVGIDGVPKAFDEFIEEQANEGFDFQEAVTVNGYTKRQSEKITLIAGDFFDISMDIINSDASNNNTLLFDAVWDRGSLVAIHPSLREKYVDKIGELINKPNGKYLLATNVRPNNDTTTGPPFSIDETEVRRLFVDKPWVDTIQLLDSHSFLSLEPWYKVMSTYMRLGNIKEEIYIITTK